MRLLIVFIVLCLKPAQMLVLLPPVEEELPEPVCFMIVGANMRREAIAVSLSASLDDCKALCADKTECEACTFNSNSGKCVLLGAQSAVPSCTCAKPYLAYEKRSCASSSTSDPSVPTAATSPSTSTTAGWLLPPTTSTSTTTKTPTTATTTPASTTTARYDPCISQAFPELTVNTTAGTRPCPVRHPDGRDGPLLVVRAVMEDGRTVTLPNMPMGEMDGGMRLLMTKVVLSNRQYVRASSFVCASAQTSSACPCAPIPKMTQTYVNCTSTPTFGAVPCANTFWWNDGNGPGLGPGTTMHLTCSDGVYIKYMSPNFYAAPLDNACCQG